MTNRDKLNQMSNEELAEKIIEPPNYICDFCNYENYNYENNYNKCKCMGCITGITEWLEREI